MEKSPMTFANPLQNYTAHEKYSHWAQYQTKNQLQLHTMTIQDQVEHQKHTKSPKLKLDMEIFSDLSTYCKPPTITIASQCTQNSQDELNTPIFGMKAPFDFDRQTTNVGFNKATFQMKSQPGFQIKSEKKDPDINNILLNNNENIVNPVGVVGGGVAATDLHSCCPLAVPFKTSDDNSIVSNINSPDMDDSYTTVLSPEDVDYFSYSTAPVKKEVSLKNEENPSNYIETDCSITIDNPRLVETSLHTNFPTPDSSRESTPSLRLDLSQQKYNPMDILQTPDIMETLESFGYEKDFNILNFVNDEDIKVAGDDLFAVVHEIPPEEPLRQSPAVKKEPFAYSLSPDETHTYALPPESEKPLSKKTSTRKRRKRTEEEDDEDYMPPSLQRKASPRSLGGGSSSSNVGSKAKKMLLDIDISKQMLEELMKTNRRGRPPKSRVSSISSDSSEFLLIDTDESKYREMRDKNNEASRRSRFKRKLKEMAVENEADELAERNVKLKAEVDELERTVTTFRNNLMKLLMNK